MSGVGIAQGLLALGGRAAPAREDLLAALADSALDVRMTAAEALFALGEGEKALPVLVALLTHPSRILRNETLLVLCRIGPPAKGALPHLAAGVGWPYCDWCVQAKLSCPKNGWPGWRARHSISFEPTLSHG